jgi:hypothetical protein
MNEARRKIAWRVHFINQATEQNMNITEKARIKFRKCNKLNLDFHADIESDIFINPNSNNLLLKKLCSNHIDNKSYSIYTKLLIKYQNFIECNKLVVQQADKNAGICIMSKKDYDSEILRQLNDESIYRPSTKVEFLFKADEFFDKVKYYNSIIFRDCNLKSFIYENDFSPCKFYILPKIHKKYDTFPVGRPISSTKHTFNQGISMLLDKILQPILQFLPEVIFDTNHFLLLLNNLKLDRDKKYLLVVSDITSMYTELPISLCKSSCISMFKKYSENNLLNSEFTTKQVEKLLSLCLDYSFIEFNGQLFLQHKGIQMGNCSSVSIANITASVELAKMNIKSMVFNVRFIDDIFAVIDVTHVKDNENYVNSIFCHNFLKFNTVISNTKVQFLDLNVHLDEFNNITTTNFRKPMNKHQFLHYNSNHPLHVLQNLPYSCGLRLIKNNSDNNLALKDIQEMFSEFKNRGYPLKLLDKHFCKLVSIDRDQLLKPKNNLVISHLKHNNPDLLNCLKISHVCKTNADSHENAIFLTFPFYKIHNYNNIISNHLLQEVHTYLINNNVLDKKIKINVSFLIHDSLKKFNQSISNK